LGQAKRRPNIAVPKNPCWVIASLDPTYQRAYMPADDTHLDDCIDTAAKALALPLEPEWKPAVKANLAITLRLGALVSELELPDEAEPAPVFRA
jgi:hypothetical protein